MANRADNFNRTGSVALGGATPSDAGSAWVDEFSSYATATDGGSGEVVAFEVSPSTENRAVLQCSVTDHEVAAVIIRADQGGGVLGRYVDANNFYMWRSFGDAGSAVPTELWKCVAGSFTKIADGSLTFVQGDTMTLRCIGASIKAYVNGVQAASVTDSDLTTGTKGGIYSHNASQFFNSFSITDMAAPATSAPISQLRSFARTRASNY